MRTRSTLIKLVHAGARKLFTDDDERRAWQKSKAGYTSCSDMTDEQLDRLVGELRAKGALHDGPPRRAGRRPFNRSPYMDKIEAQLASMGLSWQYAEAIAWRVTGGRGTLPGREPGAKRLEWVRNARDFKAIIAALEVEQKKRAKFQSITEMLKRLGLELDYVDTLVPERLRGVKWQRNLSALDTAAKHLDALLAAQECEHGEDGAP